MKGLLLKDFFSLRSQGKLYLALLVFYVFFGISTKNISMTGAFMVLVSSMLPITCLSYDESCKWDRFALTMPVSRLQMVLGKYLLGLLLNLCTLVVVLPISILTAQISGNRLTGGDLPVSAIVLSTLAICGVGLFMMAILLPVMFRFGVEKGRYVMLTVFALCFMLPVLINGMGLQLSADLPEKVSALPVWLFPVIAVAALAAVWLLSITLSVCIYRKKEF